MPALRQLLNYGTAGDDCIAYLCGPVLSSRRLHPPTNRTRTSAGAAHRGDYRRHARVGAAYRASEGRKVARRACHKIAISWRLGTFELARFGPARLLQE